MKVLIVAKTRRGSGACVGAITWEGRSVRLIAADADANERAGLEYNLGEVWELEGVPDPNRIPPHVENIILQHARRIGRLDQIEKFILRHMPPVNGGAGLLFDGLVQSSPFGALYIAERTGLPNRSTMFWQPDQPLRIDLDAKRIRYRYPLPEGGRTLTFVGFQEPVEVIPAGALLRVSLAHWWRPKDKAEEELRCYVQLSGWFFEHRQRRAEPGAMNISWPSADPRTAQQGQPASKSLPAETGTAPDLDRAHQALKQTFGFSHFLSMQEEIVRRVLQGLDSLVIMPTGGGKSLCYQLPALLFDGLTVVISPLIALMQDQVAQLREMGVPAAFLNSTLLHHEYVAITRRVRNAELKLLYLAPETLLRPETLLLLEQSHLACLAVDEAHCISEWGHDFRPEYRQIQNTRQRFPNAVCLALTATATARVREDIRRLLRIEADGQFVASFNRPNLFLAVQPRRDGLGQTLQFLEQHRDQSGIIYCSTRQQVDELATELKARAWPVVPYHAGLEDDVRRRHQDQFTREDAIVVATVAFGMGINKSNVRFILHYNLPKDLESYYQEIGRAGRDGLPADCLLLHSRADAITIRHFIEEGAASERTGRQARLEAMIRYAEATGCRRIPLLSCFGENPENSCGHCDHCLASPEPVAQTDVTLAAQKFLSCIQRTREIFGPSHIIEVLRGSRSQKVLSRGHDRLPTYGVGREFSATQWRELVRQFIVQGLVDQDLQFGSLRLTAKGRQALNGQQVLATLSSPTSPTASSRPVQPEHDQELFQKLRQLRHKLADLAKAPSYVIFSDRSLVEMAAVYPQNESQFLAINGVGQAKLAKYGTAFLNAIRDYCIPRQLTPGRPAAGVSAEPTRRISAPISRTEEIAKSFGAGQSLDELAGRFEIKRETILRHLQDYVQNGGCLDPNQVLALSHLSPSDRERVLAAFDQLGLQRLAPVHEALGGRVSYDELHLLRLYLICRAEESGHEH